MPRQRSATVDRSDQAQQDVAAKTRVQAVNEQKGNSLLVRMSDAVVEACCLFAVVSLPLYFSVLTNTGYEADKAVLARVLAALAGMAWLIASLAGRRSGTTSRESRVMLGLGLAVFLAYALATLFSIDPRLSIFGSQLRQEGLVTRAAYAVFFVCAITRIHHRQQIERLITVMLFSSVPVLFYGVLQQFGGDPIPQVGDQTTLMWPVRSTFGQHVFLGSYLVMIIPFTVARVLQNWEHRTASRNGERGKGHELLLVGAILLFSLAVFWVLAVLGYHHPSLFVLFPGFLAGYTLLGILLHQMPDSAVAVRARLWGYAGLLGVQIVVLGIVGARGPWLGFFAMIPVFGFLLAWWQRRPRIWQTVLAASLVAGIFLVLLNIPGGPLQPLRTVHGLTRIADITESGGTEVGSVKGRLLIWQGVSTLMRTHPSIGNTWGGPVRDVVGYGPESLRLAIEQVFPLKLRRATFEVWWWDRAHNIYLDYLVDAGLLALLSVLALIVLFFRRVLNQLRSADAPTAWIFIALGSAITAHLVDGMFGLEMAVTLTLFWLILGFGGRLRNSDTDEDSSISVQAWSPTSTAWIWGGVILLTAVVVFLAPETIPAHPWLLATVWLATAVGGVAVVARAILVPLPSAAPGPGSGKVTRKRTASSVRVPRVPIAFPLITVAGCTIILASQLQIVRASIADRNGTTSYATGQGQAAIAYLQQAVRANSIEPVYLAELGAAYRGLASTASTYPTDSRYHPTGNDAKTIDPQTVITLGRKQFYALSAAAFISAHSLSPLEADLYGYLGDTYQAAKQPWQAIDAYQHAEHLSVNNPKYVALEALADVAAHRYAEAIRRGTLAVHLDSNYWYGHFALARAYHAAGRHAEARREAQLGLFWVPVFSPPPPRDQVQQLKTLQQTG